jgi:hypothetical protein
VPVTEANGHPKTRNKKAPSAAVLGEGFVLIRRFPFEVV